MERNTINIEVKQVVSILVDLEYLVTSLDRIGSAEICEEDQAKEVNDFVTEGNVFKRLARMRKLISKALDENISSRSQRSIDRKIEKVRPWKLKRLHQQRT